MKWHSININEIFEELGTSPRGLTEEEAKKRVSKYGHNQIEEEEPINKLAILLEQIKNPIVYIIIITALITLIFQKYTDTIVIGIVILFNTTIGFIQEYKAESSLQALKLMVSPECDVIRDCPKDGMCVEMRIKATEVVPGDILILDGGDKVPADARIFESMNLEIDESMLTGESVSVRKDTKKHNEEALIADRTNMVYAGTVVTYGRAKAVVVETGMSTEIGKIAEMIKSTGKEKTPLQLKLVSLVKILGFLALFSSLITFLIGFIQGIELFDMFFFAVASAVSAIPEGLPVVMTITLAIGVNRMAKKKAVIRKLNAVDTLGAATVICTDKTGTLTTNQMTARKIFVDNQLIDVTGIAFNLDGQFEIDGKELENNKVQTLDSLLHNAVLCNDARLRSHKLEEDERKWEVYGDPTEGALLILAAKKGIHKEELSENYTRVDEIPFSSKSKYMVTFHENSSEKVRVYIKGAPEVVLDLCSNKVVQDQITKLTPEDIEDVNVINQDMAANALRTLAFASQTIESHQIDNFKEEIENGGKLMNFLGLIGMIDPPRPEVPKALKLCKQAGIKVIMATGDHKITAEAIGREIGLFQEGSDVLTGKDLENLSDDELDEKIDHIVIFARVSPEDKYRIVSSLKRKNHVVCMTGDGVNDAPALKLADVGVAMGITGTDVAKEASEMVLMDDDFSTIVNAVEEGRVIFQNIRKVVKYLVCTNIGEDITIMISLLLLPLLFGELFLIFTPVQILWVNLVTDGILDVTLAMEGKESDVMAYPPRDPEEPIFNREIFLNIIFVGTIMMIGTFCIFVHGLVEYDLIKARSLAFTTMAMYQVFNSLNCRSRTKSVFELGFFSNKYLFVAISASVILQISAIYMPLFNIILGTTPFSIDKWLLIVSVASTVFIGDELRKLIRKIVLRRII